MQLPKKKQKYLEYKYNICTSGSWLGSDRVKHSLK